MTKPSRWDELIRRKCGLQSVIGSLKREIQEIDTELEALPGPPEPSDPDYDDDGNLKPEVDNV